MKRYNAHVRRVAFEIHYLWTGTDPWMENYEVALAASLWNGTPEKSLARTREPEGFAPGIHSLALGASKNAKVTLPS
jgi:hypothetical protein